MSKKWTQDILYTGSGFKYYYTLNSLSLFWFVESVQWIFEISACDVISADYTIIMSRTLKVTGNHVKFARFVFVCCQWRSKNMTSIFFVQCIIKQLLDSVFVISRIIKVSARVITKTSPNNCLVYAGAVRIILDEACTVWFDVVTGERFVRGIYNSITILAC